MSGKHGPSTVVGLSGRELATLVRLAHRTTVYRDTETVLAGTPGGEELVMRLRHELDLDKEICREVEVSRPRYWMGLVLSIAMRVVLALIAVSVVDDLGLRLAHWLSSGSWSPEAAPGPPLRVTAGILLIMSLVGAATAAGLSAWRGYGRARQDRRHPLRVPLGGADVAAIMLVPWTFYSHLLSSIQHDAHSAGIGGGQIASQVAAIVASVLLAPACLMLAHQAAGPYAAGGTQRPGKLTRALQTWLRWTSPALTVILIAYAVEAIALPQEHHFPGDRTVVRYTLMAVAVLVVYGLAAMQGRRAHKYATRAMLGGVPAWEARLQVLPWESPPGTLPAAGLGTQRKADRSSKRSGGERDCIR